MKKNIRKMATKIAVALIGNKHFFKTIIEEAHTPDNANEAVAKAAVNIAKHIVKNAKE